MAKKKQIEAIKDLKHMYIESTGYYLVIYTMAVMAILFGIYAALRSPLIPAICFLAIDLWFVYMVRGITKQRQEICKNYNNILKQLS